MAMVVLTCGVWADAAIVALKRDALLDVNTGLDATFKTAMTNGTMQVYSDASSGKDMVNDTDLWYSTSYTTNGYRNTGLNAKARALGGSTFVQLYKFDLSALPGFVGGTVNKAQLRLYYGAGNSGYSVGYITSTNWSEGNKGDATNGDGNFPGAGTPALGATLAHPNALNTAANQNGSGGTTAPLQGWGVNHDSWWTEAGDGSPSLKASAAFASYSTALPSGTNPSYDGFATMNVLSMVQLWAAGTPNYGFYGSVYSNNRDVNFSETLVGASFQPVLVLDYTPVPEPMTLVLLALSSVGLIRMNRRRA
jgi:hypothetical protein